VLPTGIGIHPISPTDIGIRPVPIAVEEPVVGPLECVVLGVGPLDDSMDVRVRNDPVGVAVEDERRQVALAQSRAGVVPAEFLGEDASDLEAAVDRHPTAVVAFREGVAPEVAAAPVGPRIEGFPADRHARVGAVALSAAANAEPDDEEPLAARRSASRRKVPPSSNSCAIPWASRTDPFGASS
jgi:hypothetical protein